MTFLLTRGQWLHRVRANTENAEMLCLGARSDSPVVPQGLGLLSLGHPLGEKKVRYALAHSLKEVITCLVRMLACSI